MKDYRINKKENLDDILKITKSAPIVDENGKEIDAEAIDVHFADGKVFKGVAKTDEQLKKILQRQESQVDAGIENLPAFQRRVKLSGAAATVSMVAGPIISSVGSSMITPIFNMESDPIKIACAGVVIGLCGAIPAGIGVVKNLPIVKELSKLKYRNDHRDELNSIGKHPNALVGLSESEISRINSFEPGQDPFNVGSVDDYTQTDLETIIDNIQREKDFDFQYVKTPKSAPKNKEGKRL